MSILYLRNPDGKFVPIPAIVGPPGEPGKDGKDGHTPVKGEDYFTESDRAQIVSDVLAVLPVYNGEVADA